MADNTENSEKKTRASVNMSWLIWPLVLICGGTVGLLAALTLIDVLEKKTPAQITSTQEAIAPENPAPRVGNFSQIRACIITSRDRIPVTMYLANTDELRTKGLQGVPALPSDTGMLFVYDSVRAPASQFWMHDTLMNLDIAYLDGDGAIRTIQQMPSCDQAADSCPRYQAGVPFLAAAEFPQGFFRDKGVTVGDRISTDFFAHCSNS